MYKTVFVANGPDSGEVNEVVPHLSDSFCFEPEEPEETRMVTFEDIGFV